LNVLAALGYEAARRGYLPDLGIRGNSHMLMQDRNSNQLAEPVPGWTDAHIEAE